MTISVYFEPRDLWVGVYWKRTPGRRYVRHPFTFGSGNPCTDLTEAVTRWDVFVCLLPMLPICFTWFRPRAFIPLRPIRSVARSEVKS